MFTSLAFLDEPKLPPDCADWSSDLNPEKTISQEEVDAALQLFEAKQMKSISCFLEYYLDLDCTILLRSIVAMHDLYYQFLQLSFVESRKWTVSSFASTAAQTWLARRKRPANYFPNHCRLYSLLKQSLRGGLCNVARTVCGARAQIDDYIALLQRQMESGAEDGGPDLDLCQRVQDSGLDLRSYITNCNAHILPKGTTSHPAVTAIYADINS